MYLPANVCIQKPHENIKKLAQTMRTLHWQGAAGVNYLELHVNGGLSEVYALIGNGIYIIIIIDADCTD